MESNVLNESGGKLLRILVVTLIISVTSATMFNIVLPQIREEFHLTLAQGSWITSAYILIYAVGTIVYGKLADKYRLKQLLSFGLPLFAVGSLIGLLSQAFWMVLAGRALQAAGAAVIPATALLIPVRYFPAEKRGMAIGTAMVGLALGNALSPVISALLASVVNWRWLFAIPLLTLLTLPFYRKYLGNESGKGGSIDALGGALLAAGVTLLLLGISNESWLLGSASMLVLALFVARIMTAKEPFIQPRLFRNKTYTFYLATTFLMTGIGYSLVFLSPILLADVQRLSSGWIGLAMVPAAAVSAFLGRKGGKLADAKGAPFLFYAASGMLTVCFVLLSTFAASPTPFIALFLVIGNVGQTFMGIALSSSISKTLPKEEVGVGMGMFSMMNFISGSVAVVLYGKAIDLGSVIAWNPVHAFAGGTMYSNVYLVLAAMHVVMLVFGYFEFRKPIRINIPGGNEVRS